MSECPNFKWAFQQRGLLASERVVLCYLAERANGAKVCWPSVDTIATDCELSVRTVQSALGYLSGEKPRSAEKPKAGESEASLCRSALIRIQRRLHQSNHYYILRSVADNGSTPPEPKERKKPPVMDIWDQPIEEMAEIAPVEAQNLQSEAPNGANPAPAKFAEPATPAPLTPQVLLPEPAKTAAPPPAKTADESPKQVRTPQGEVSNSNARTRASEPPGFAAFYAAYPRKEARPAAARAFAAAVKRGLTAEQLLIEVQRYPFGTERQYIPHPATWLNQDRWNDDPPPRGSSADQRTARVVGAAAYARELNAKMIEERRQQQGHPP